MKALVTAKRWGKKRARLLRRGLSGARATPGRASAGAAVAEQASQRFEQLFQGLPVSCFCYDTEGRIMEWNRESEALFRRPAAEAVFLPVWDVVGRAEDAEILRAVIRSVLAGQAYEGLEWRQPIRGDAPRRLLCHAFPLRDRAGAIYGGVTASVDISGRAQAEQALRESEERWQLALRGNNDGIWDWDARRGQVFLSARCREIFGEGDGPEPAEAHSPEELRAAWFARVHPDDRAGAAAALAAHLGGETAFYSSEHRLGGLDGGRWVLDRGQALWDRAGTLVRVAGSVTDITERKRWEENVRDGKRKLEEANRRLEALATEDGLTGLKNHRAFQERLAMEAERARRYGSALSVVMLDVDQFKRYNDAFGHPAGDAVLRTVAACLRAGVRETDLAARYGGEEFALVLPETDRAGAAVVAERVRAAIEGAAWTERPITASVGVATLRPAQTGPADLIAAADQALYRSKEGGRNRVTAAE